MIFIDAREGLSGDMLLAAMIGILHDDRMKHVSDRIGTVARTLAIDFRLLEVEEGKDKGHGIIHVSRDQLAEEVSYDEAFSRLDQIQTGLSSDSDVPHRILNLIFEAEAQAHGIPPGDVHLHEIGRPQALLNMAGIGLLHSELTSLGVRRFVCSTITTGKGIVVVSHGAVRVPAPASKNLLNGLKHIEGDDPGERATPTGIAAVKAITRTQTDTIPEVIIKKSIGFGTKRFGGRLGRTTLIWAK